MQRTGLALATVWLGACASVEDLGPLAVADAARNGDAARTEGVLHMTDECVYVVVGGGRTMALIWPAAETGWRPDRQAITFERRSGDVVELVDGDTVELGGSARDIADWTNIVRSVEWLHAPGAGCIAQEAWFVGEAGRL